MKRRVLKTCKPVQQDVQLNVQGRRNWFHLVVHPRRDAAGKVIGLLCAARDITVRKETDEKRKLSLTQVQELVEVRTAELQRERERLDLALQASNLGTWDSYRISGRVVYDKHFCAVLGFAEGGIAPDLHGWLDRVHPEDRERVLDAVRQFDRGDSATYFADYRCRHKEGHWVWVRASGKVASRNEAGQPLRVVGTIQDITASRQVEQEGIAVARRTYRAYRAVLASDRFQRLAHPDD